MDNLHPLLLMDKTELRLAKKLIKQLDDENKCKQASDRLAELSEAVLEHLLRENFVSLGEDGQYIPAVKFIQLASAKITDGLPRSEATALLQRVIERAGDINARPTEFDHHITRLAVFGSYLGGNELLGDLDIAFDYQRNPEPVGIPVKPWSYRKSAGNLSKMLSYLRLRKRRQISLHTWEEINRLKTPYKVVFEYEPRKNRK